MTLNPTTSPAQTMADVLARLWVKHLPEIENRLLLLESAVQAQNAGALADDRRETAHQAAHKLAGVLGTFGLPRGTDLARQIELELAEAVPSSSTVELSAWVGELRLLIDSRKS